MIALLLARAISDSALLRRNKVHCLAAPASRSQRAVLAYRAQICRVFAPELYCDMAKS